MWRFLPAVLTSAMLALSSIAARAQDSLQISSNGSDIATLDPHRASATTDKVLIGWMYSGLARFPPGSADPKDLEPDLAEHWETSSDGKTWTFHTRPGAGMMRS